jgi:ribonuclease R
MNASTISRGPVYDALRAHGPRALHLAEICSRLDVDKARRDDVLDVLDELIGLGLVREMPGLRFRAIKGKDPQTKRRPEAKVVTGRLTVVPRGFGFVAAEQGGPDVFVRAEHLAGALHGDRVRVSARPSAKGLDGEVLEILDRGRSRLGGVLRRAQRTFFVEPDDPRLPGPYPVDGEVPREIHAGQMVVVEITEYPAHPDDPPRVRVVDALGEPGEIRAEVEALKLRHGVVEPFPAEVRAEASRTPMRLGSEDLEGREDLRHLDLVTIDPPDARDHDDAVWGERRRDGGFRILIAIADVAHYVREGTTLDQEAFSRGVSVYLPDRAIPMLPPEISSTMASLVPDEDRLTMAVEVDLAPDGAVVGHRFVQGVIRSRARLDYAGVARALGWTDAAARSEAAEGFLPMLELLAECTGRLRSRRRKRGSLDFDLPEPKVLLDVTTGAPTEVSRQKGDPGVRKAYRLIEDLMLLANEVVAAHLEAEEIPTVYRVHGEPDEDRLGKFAKLATSLGHVLDVEDAADPRRLAKFLRKVEGSPEAGPLNYLLLRSMQQAIYSVDNIGHFGLGAKAYLHFTSPIRRYPDLLVHRVVKELLAGRSDRSGEREDGLRTAAAESSKNERAAADLERDVIDLYRVFLVRDRVGEEFEGTVSGVADHGFYATFDDPFVDALIPVERLSDDFYELNELGLRLVGQRTGRSFGLGDRVTVRLEEASIERRQLVAIPVAYVQPDREPGEPRRRGPRSRRAGDDDDGGFDDLDDVDQAYLDADREADGWGPAPRRRRRRPLPGRAPTRSTRGGEDDGGDRESDVALRRRRRPRSTGNPRRGPDTPAGGPKRTSRPKRSGKVGSSKARTKAGGGSSTSSKKGGGKGQKTRGGGKKKR